MADPDPTSGGRRIEWATRTITEGEVLAAFASHCRDDLDDVEIVTEEPARLVARWRRETSRLELAATVDPLAVPDDGEVTMLLGDLAAGLPTLVDAFVADEGLRNRVAVCDLERLEKINAVRSSVFVYFEWFLRDEYGVKLLPAAAFTQALIQRGVISLGFG